MYIQGVQFPCHPEHVSNPLLPRSLPAQHGSLSARSAPSSAPLVAAIQLQEFSMASTFQDSASLNLTLGAMASDQQLWQTVFGHK